MPRKKRANSLLCVLVVVLFFLLLVPLLFPVLGSPDEQDYDYVDNNTSNVDASPDKGTHSNFTAQQYGPDTIYDTLTEENTGGADWGFTWLDSPIEKTYTTTSQWIDLDLSGDVPASATGVIVAEVSDTSSDLHIVVRGKEDTNDYMSSTSYCEFEDETWRMQIVKLDANRYIQYWSDNTALRLFVMGYTEGNDPKYRTVPVQLPELTADSAWHTISVDGYVDDDSDGVILLGQVTSGSDTTLLVRAAGSTDAMTAREWEEYNIGLLVVKIDANDKFEYYLTSGDLARLFLVAETKGSIDWLDTNRDDMSPTSTGWTMRDLDDYITVPADASGAFLQFESAGSWGDYQNIAREYGTSWTFPRFDVGGDQWLMGGSGINDQNQLEIYIENTQDDCYLHAITRKGISVNYQLDLEVQWTNATYNLPNEELCIYGGTMGSENVQVDVWNGSIWHNLFTDLSSGWNNVSVTDYLVSSTFTIRFKGGTEAGDTSQDSWEIDCTLLHTWGAAPIANFSYTPEYPYTDETVTFNASESYDPDGSIVSYFWDFGDGTNGTGEIITHSYADNGTYTVVLTVTDNDGLFDTISADVTVLNRPPVAIFTESTETAYVGETITFNASDSYDPDGSIATYFWDFGDGTNTTGVIVEHAYSANGTYIVTLTVIDDNGASGSTSSTKTILRNEPPIAIFTESAETVYTDEIIYFNASDSYDSDGYIVSYFWDFGDDTNATGVTVNHAYVDDGVYTVTLTVTDDRGATSSTSATKTVLNRHPTASFTESAETVYTGEIVTFNASDSYDPDGTIVNYFWDFGDDTNVTGILVTHAYADNGTYIVTLTVTDDDGATASANATKTVLNSPPVASFTESAETVYTGAVIGFNASSSYDPDGSIVSYFWDFGDGTNATGTIVEHAYVGDGIYAVTLTIADDDGATDTATATKTVLNRPPVAVFTESAETVYTGETITFDASDSYDPDGTIISYFWDFGDGSNATGVVVDHSYADDGNYTVTLMVTDDDGATDSTSAIKTVLNRPPVASFAESAETVYTGETITFNASDSYDPDGTIVNYFWDFGDGTNATGILVNHSYTDNGNYTVILTVTDDDGAMASASATKTVFNRPPVASFTESAETVLTGETITFNASDSYDPDGTIVNYFWDFGDGTNATGVVAYHAYTDNDNYTITLTVTDDDEAADSVYATKTVLNRPPVASFSESAETVYTGDTITFNATDSYDPDGIIVNYFWDFGDGSNATGVVVAHAYAEDGNYTVTLIVTDDDGATGSTSATKTILNMPPVASFTESAETVYTDESITFNASDSYDSDGTIVSYFWDFGDGTNATGMVVDHAYVDDGNYTVVLIVTDDDGDTGTTTAIKTALNRPPVASFTESAETVYTGESITFNASDSYDSDGTIVSYFWDFGDGTNATGKVVDHAYADDGNYTVTLTVTDDDGAIDTSSASKTVLNRAPVASFAESAETVYTGETITLNASSSYDPDGSIASYFWDFGDGTNATGAIVSHSYTDDGVYVVTLTVTDDDGATASANATKTVLNSPPVASFTESAETVYTGEIIYFNASSSYDPDGSIVSYFWDFGDGANATDVVVSHSYVDDGNYTVTLTVTDDDGATNSTSAIKTVLNRPPVANFTESAETTLTGESITFNASASYDPDGTVVNYFWDFGDGTNSTGVVVYHAYVDDGVYTVTLTVTDDDGANSSTSATKTVLNRPPVATFTESAETVYTGETITFTASESYDSDGTIVSYFWDFGDGTNASGIIVEHAYADDGNYTVTLTVTDDDGTTDTTSATKIVLNSPPVASFTESAETVYTGDTITFNASDSYDPDGTIVNYSWDFGDGTNATGEIVEHTYADDGNYTVTLTVTDDDGATDNSTATKTVLNQPPVASFTESAETVYIGESITFNASDSYDSDGTIVSYFWDFGDGTNASGIIVEHAYADDGNYTVTLTVTDDDGTTDTTSATKIVLNSPPVASFTESAETALTGATITFDASNSYDSDGVIVDYFWDFGDGTNAAGVTIGHAYADDGNYTVTLTVTDDDGGTGAATAIKTVLNRSPVATFSESATVVNTGTIIYFDASDSYDPDGTIVSYFWDFGDGTNATGATSEHAYADDGSYVVTLTVTDDDGATGVATATKKVLNRPPVTSFTESAGVVYTSEVISFNASESYDPDGYIVSYFWDFGDGTNATSVIIDHAYADDGNYTVTLTVTDDDGATASTTATKSVLNRSPIALFTESAESVAVGETIYFNASDSYDPDGTVVSYFWDFGDGTNATGVTTEHGYSDSGVYTVTLTVTDDDGATGTASAQKTVEVTPPVAIFTESVETAFPGESIKFNATESYDPDGSIVSYFWDFGDDTNGTGVVVEYAYADDGTFTVTLTVTDDDGASDSATSTKTVLNRAPIASFTESAETVCIGQPITFNASDSYDLDGFIVSCFWDFGDGTNATGTLVDHAYSTNGTYQVTLTVLDDDTASDSTSATKTILWNEKPVASFTESAETVFTNEVIYFNASESYDLDGTIVGCFWDFGDGTNATGTLVDHAYTENGNYTTTLTVTDDRGATNTATATKTVFNRPPVASFTESAEEVQTGEVINFNASASYDPDGVVVSYFWDFGDGTNATTVSVSHSYTDNGTYIVTLVVTDNDGDYNSTTAAKTVLNNLPVAVFSESAETIHTGESITFNASNSYDPDGFIVSCFWDFGDGTNATGVVVEHVYSLYGTFIVALTITDDDGGIDVATATKTVLWNEPPVALFTESAETVYKGEIIVFNASESYDLDGNITSYLWDFGDGMNGTGMIIEHTYLYCGNYIVRLKVTDNKGSNDTATATKTVISRPPVALFSESAETVYTGEYITFDASASYDPDGVVVSYFWDFGDGTSATGVIVDNAYLDDGMYTVTLTVKDSDNASGSTSADKTVLNRAPLATFTVSAETVYTGEYITFDASASYDLDGIIISYFWDFGDGGVSEGACVTTHPYFDHGNYVVELTVTDDDGSTGTTTLTITVLNRPPVASITVSEETSYVGASITFDASSSYDLDGYITMYWWDFGDGTTDTSVTVNHAYSINGTFTVTLRVRDDDKASHSTNITITILWNEVPVALFTESSETVHTYETIVFNASNSYDLDDNITGYLWDFGDGTTATGITAEHSYADDGNYTVTLTVKDGKGATSSATAVKTILNRSPVAWFVESKETAYIHEPIIFNASISYDPDGNIVDYFWDFGDGTNATGVVVSHAYSINGTFTVTLRVRDDDNASNLAQASKSVLYGGRHDVAVVDIIPSAIEIYKHQVLNVTIVVSNEGTLTETFNVTLYREAVLPGWRLIEENERLVWFCDGENLEDYLLATSITVPTENPVLTFDTKYSIEFLWDFGFVQISRDGGATWKSLVNANTTYAHDPRTDPGIIENLPGFTGKSQGFPASWVTMTFNLTDYAGETVILGFRYMTDGLTLWEGWYVNNIRVNNNTISNLAFEQYPQPPASAIQAQTVRDLLPSSQTILIFSWNTTSTRTGIYTISAIADTIEGETDTDNNKHVDGTVEVKICPDIDRDGDVDLYDAVIVCRIYGCREGEDCWYPKADLVEDGVINLYDVVAVCSQYGKTFTYS